MNRRVSMPPSLVAHLSEQGINPSYWREEAQHWVNAVAGACAVANVRMGVQQMALEYVTTLREWPDPYATAVLLSAVGLHVDPHLFPLMSRELEGAR